MRIYDKIFIAYSPIQLLSAVTLCTADSLVITPRPIASKTLYNVNCLASFRYISIPSFSSPFHRKVYSLLYILSLFPRHSCVTLYSPSASHYFVQLLVSRLAFKHLYFIDEGNISLSMIRHSHLPDIHNSSIFVRALMALAGVRIGKDPLDDKFSAYYVHHLSAFVKCTGVNTAYQLPSCSNIILRRSMFNIPTSKSVVIVVTSPLTENNWVNFPGQEIDLIDKYIRALQERHDVSIYLKLHYRETVQKYSRFLSDNPSVVVLDSEYPLQLILAELSSLNAVSLVGFHSSALFCSEDVSSIVSLSNLINTPTCSLLAKGLEPFMDYFPQFSFATSKLSTS
ncbi:glycosyltransferase 52 family protein [Synechococcus sp. RS9915]|nr:glycosyltransferase 52 family protein [Synechococcus sp. RS9915]